MLRRCSRRILGRRFPLVPFPPTCQGWWIGDCWRESRARPFYSIGLRWNSSSLFLGCTLLLSRLEARPDPFHQRIPERYTGLVSLHVSLLEEILHQTGRMLP